MYMGTQKRLCERRHPAVLPAHRMKNGTRSTQPAFLDRAVQ